MPTMRTTLTLDPDVSARLEAEVRRTERALKVVVNDALRRGLHGPARAARRAAYAVRPVRMVFRAGVDLGKLNALADELEAETAVAKLRR